MKITNILLSTFCGATLALTFSACANQAATTNTAANGAAAANSATANASNTANNSAATTGNSNAASGDSAQSNNISSIYTDLSEGKCKTIESTAEEAGSYVGECAGVGGYKLEVLEGDLRQSINVVAPNGKKHELNLWSNVSPAFSSLGEKAEWRVTGEGEKAKPTALIVRYNAADKPEKPEGDTSYLVVTKINGDSVCVTDVVKPSKDANVEARRLADTSADKPCLAKK